MSASDVVGILESIKFQILTETYYDNEEEDEDEG